MSKLSFRARALDASKPMPIYMAEELPDLPEYSAINRAVPQMPSGMEKEEECEHHLQRAICAGLIIPTPEVSEANIDAYDKLYPPNYKQPRQLIHMQPLVMEQDIPDYDMDSEDERWLVSQAKKLDLAPLKFEEMMDRLEKSSGQTVVTLNEAKALLKEDDDLIIAVFDYWLNKRLKTQHPLILSVKTEHRTGLAANNPYLAFRRRTEKMQTRKNRKNDETSYEKMLKLRRDLSRAVTLLELVKRREKSKREYLHLTIEICEKRYQAQDFSGAMLAEVSALKASRPAFTQIFQNHYSNQSWVSKSVVKDDIVPRKEKRQYKKRKHKNSTHGRLPVIPGSGMDGLASSDEEETIPQQPSPEPEETEDDGQFAFRRNKLCSYHMPISNGMGNWPWCGPLENGLAERKYRYTLTSLAHPRRCIGFARRRVGRGGRVILDRVSTDYDDLWRHLDFSIMDSVQTQTPTIAMKSAETAASRKLSADAASWTVIKDNASSTSDTNVLNSNLLRNSSAPPMDSSSSVVVGSVCGGNSQTWLANHLASEVICSDDVDVTKCEVRKEILERTEVCAAADKCDQDDMLEFLQDMRRDGWLHFRPKTPPPSYDESTCIEEPLFNPLHTTPITVELQNLTSCPSTLLDDSLFTTEPFTLQDLCPELVGDASVPFDDTRQRSPEPAFGCSRFRVVNTSCNRLSDPSSANISERAPPAVANVCVTPNKQSILSSTLTSPKYNSVNMSSSSSCSSLENRPKHTVVNHISNGPSHSELISSGRRGNKMQHNAYTSGMSSARGCYVTATSTLNSERNTRFAAHSTVTTHNTLNSHSANNLDISSQPHEHSGDSAKMNLQCVDNNVTGTTATATTATTNNKQNSKQTIVRKNNSLPMEVT